MRYFLPVLIVGFLISATSCGNRKAESILSQAEETLGRNPSLALELLRDSDSTIFSTKQLRADYSLLYARALRLNGIDTDDVSIIMPAVDYYKKNNPSIKRVRSLLALGQIQMNKGDNIAALVSLIKAQQLSEKIDDPDFQAELALSLGDVYSQNFLFEEAIPYYERSRDYTRNSGDTVRMLISSYSLARALNDLGRFSQADSLFTPLLRYHQKMNPQVFSRIMADYGLVTVAHKKDYILGQIYYNYAFTHSDQTGHFDHLGPYAYAMERTGMTRKADSLLNVIREYGLDSLYSSLVWKSRLVAHRGDYQQAYALLETATEMQSNDEKRHLGQSALNARADSYEQALLLSRRENRWIRLIVLLMLCIAATVLFFVLSAARKRQESLIETARGLTCQLDDLQEERESLQRQFARIHQTHLKEYGSLLKTTLGTNQTNIEAKRIILYEKARRTMDAIVDDKDKESAFEEKLNRCFDNVMMHLKKELPNHTPEYYRFAGFVFAGFDNETLMAITKTQSLDSIYAKKKRLRQDIARSKAEHKGLFARLVN